MENQWNAKKYNDSFYFVPQLGQDLLKLLSPVAGESILDLGCGTGALTCQIAGTGISVLGIDASDEMVKTARKNYPEISFQSLNALDMTFEEAFDGVFSNAVLHWILAQEQLSRNVFRALKSGGRFVAEFGGANNCAVILETLFAILKKYGRKAENSFYYPNVEAHKTLLETCGFLVPKIYDFDRPTPLQGENGMKDWLQMFCGGYLIGISEKEKEHILDETVAALKPRQYQHGRWIADYRRIVVKAVKG